MKELVLYRILAFGKNALKQIGGYIDKNYSDSCIILEDDIVFLENFCQDLIKFYTDFLNNPKYEFVRLMALNTKKQANFKIFDKNLNIFISYKKPNGAQGYFLSKEGAQKFLKKAKFWLYPIDDYMDMFFWHNVKNLCFLPFLIGHSGFETTIYKRGKKPKIRYKISRELCRFLWHIRTKFHTLKQNFLKFNKN